MIDESCKVPRENLDDGFNPCRKQVVENGELCQYAHMYDVMNERYDREDETSYLDWAKRDKITSTTPVLLAGNNTQIYANSTNGEGRVNMLPSSAFSNPDNHTEASIPSAKAVADYVTANTPDVDVLEAEIYTKVDKITNDTYYVGANAQVYARELSTGNNGYMDVLDVVTLSGHSIPTSGAVMGYAPIPLPVSKGGTGGNTPYRTDALDASSTFVMHDAPNDRYDAAPMSALTGYLDGRYDGCDVSVIPNSTDLNTIVKPGKYGTTSAQETNTIVNKPDNITHSFLMEIGKANGSSEMYQRITELITFITYERTFNSGSLVFNDWTLLYPTTAPSIPNPLPVDQGGTGAQTRRLKTAAGLTLLPVIDSIGASGALNGYTSVTNIATFITTNNIRPEIEAAFESRTADAVAYNNLLPTNALMMDYVDGSLINYNEITVSGGGTSNINYNRVRLKNNRIYGDCDFTVNSEGVDGEVNVYIKINGTDVGIPPVFNKFLLSNKPLLVHVTSNTIIEGKNIYNVSNGKVIVQFNIGDFNTGEFIFIIDSVFTGYNQPM